MPQPSTALRKNRDIRWLIIWLSGVTALAIWDILFLNRPALKRVAVGFASTLTIALLVIVFTLILGWVTTLVLHYLEQGPRRAGYMVVRFMLDLIRSVPQVVGILLGYVAVSMLRQSGRIASDATLFVLLALIMSLFIFLELVDLMRERIAHYRKLDFYNAMRVCGIPDRRIINFDILWKNSRIHIFNKLISVFGMAVFLQCSVDFVISVGLSSDVSEVSLPTTLGSLLAKIDSKQDILAIGHTLTHPGYVPNLFLQHLQGVTVAFLIVFTLLSVYHIANGYAERHRL
ncbi:MAG: ABC transporter permease subunit [Chitinivibrionales bacterium]|nr:ABC transporter permease subunit [Chitinivibrionales bacterium]